MNAGSFDLISHRSSGGAGAVPASVRMPLMVRRGLVVDARTERWRPSWPTALRPAGLAPRKSAGSAW